MVKRKEKLLVLELILKVCVKNPLTVNEIATLINSHWITVRECIDFAVSHGIMIRIKKGQHYHYITYKKGLTIKI